MVFRGPAGLLSPRTVRELPAPQTLSGPWELRLPGRTLTLPQLISWSDHSLEELKYFSGTAAYMKEFELPRDATNALFLDLGEVKEIAEVELNGTDFGVLWKPPFVVEVTAAIRPGRNHLVIRITNLWPNRLIGDQRLPPEKRRAWTTWSPYTKDSPLLPSGLLGPVVLRTA